MKFFIVLSLILSVFSLTFAGESVGFFTDPDHPGKCVYDDVILSPGEEVTLPGQCARFSCGEDSFASIHSVESVQEKMKFLIFLALIVTVFSEDYSGYFRDPDHPGKCVRDGIILSPGDVGKVPGECALMTCYDDGYATFQTVNSVKEKMKFFAVLSIILSVFSLAFAAESVGYFKDPAHPGKCVYGELILSAGEEANLPGDCTLFMCGEDSFGTIQTVQDKMKFLVFLFLILSVCSLTFAALSQGYFKDPAHPGKCVYQGLVLSAGEEGKIPGACARMLCGSNSFAEVQTCGVMVPPPGCHYGDYIDINAPYAKCCEKKMICD
ncbi:hypothetical protein FF38_04347 [Lucilia cuprina]|uniref:Single domain-containing protein n=1 Tax=Lucilia cuprina TaxID=7375 RepID=A0A0L0C6Y3_LUCCU|nr:hypothetical protein FF38_04347 [Lucilia cuprina]